MSGEEGLAMLIQTFKKEDNRHIYASGSNNYLGLKESRRMKIISRLAVSGVKTTSSSTPMPVPLSHLPTLMTVGI